jgi:hypothetical protein
LLPVIPTFRILSPFLLFPANEMKQIGRINFNSSAIGIAGRITTGITGNQTQGDWNTHKNHFKCFHDKYFKGYDQFRCRISALISSFTIFSTNKND